MVERETWVSVVALATGLGWSLAVMGGLVSAGGALFGAVNLLCLAVSVTPWALSRAGLMRPHAPTQTVPLDQIIYSPQARTPAPDLFEFIIEEQVPVPLSKVPMVESGHFIVDDLEYCLEDTGSFEFNPEEVARRIAEGLSGMMDFKAEPAPVEMPSIDIEFDGWSMPEEMPLESMTIEARILALEAAIQDDEARHRGVLAKSI